MRIEFAGMFPRHQRDALRRRGFTDDIVQSEMAAALRYAFESRLAQYEARA
jgi:hypothetical protein